MARANKNQTATTNNGGNSPFYTKCTICGVVKDLYEGKKYDYVTIDVPHSYDNYYDRFNVAVSKNYPVPDDGETIALDCTLKSYKGNISIKEVNADTQ